MFRTLFKKTLKQQIIILFLAASTIFAASGQIFAQFTFIGDYDRANFASPLGYYVEPQNNLPGDAIPNRQTYMVSGELNPDGSIIAGGRILGASGGDFWLRKFTASGAVDTSFGGGGGFVRTVFSTDVNNIQQNSIPTVLKRQPDGKIVFGGICTLGQQGTQTIGPGTDFCLVRYNADGSIDTSFGGFSFQFAGPTNFLTHTLSPGRVWIKSGIDEDGTLYGSSSQLLDMAIQPDGKIIVVGTATSRVNPYFQGVGTARTEGIIVRFNSNGTLDTSFGLNASGIARWIPANTGTGSSPCYPARAFSGVRLQTDGRIIAVGYDGVSDSGCFQGQVFAVTRWNANGTLETARRLDAETSVFARENAVSALITNDGGKLLVSGDYQGNPTLTRFNLSDMTLDASFGTNGVLRYTGLGNNVPLYIKAIQPDGKILAIDGATNNPVSRLNPNGSPDNSFGNAGFDGNNSRGRLNIPVNTFNTVNVQPSPAQILLRPNGKFNIIGSAVANEGGNSPRSFVSQHINVSRQNTTSDLTNDGRAELSVFRPSTGVWHQLDSSSNAYSAFNWGISGDKLAPADFDGDGRADVSVFRDGVWYIFQSSNNQVRIVNFGLANDVPRPADFDGDGYADIAVFRPSTGSWYWLNSSNNQFLAVQFGQNADAPLIADFDGDGRADFSVFRSGVWYFLRSSNLQVGIVQFGLAGDIPVVGDYDGDGKSDIAVFRPPTGVWYLLRSSDNGFQALHFGLNGDKPTPGDYDNDGKNDPAVYRNGLWYVLKSGDNSVAIANFGLSADIPIPSVYLP